jgi:hypothetical protein
MIQTDVWNLVVGLAYGGAAVASVAALMWKRQPRPFMPEVIVMEPPRVDTVRWTHSLSLQEQHDMNPSATSFWEARLDDLGKQAIIRALIERGLIKKERWTDQCSGHILTDYELTVAI